MLKYLKRFEVFLFVFESVGFSEMYFCIFGVSCILNCYFYAFIRFCVFFCIYEHILKMFSTIVGKCPENVLSYGFRRKILLVFSAGNITGMVGGKYYC